MKNTIIMFFLCIGALHVNCQKIYGDLSENDSVPKELQILISAVKSESEFIEIPDFSYCRPPKCISKMEAHEDIKMLKYLFDNAYSGRYYWEQNGFSFTDCYSSLNKYVDTLTEDSVEVKSFEEVVFKCFSGINDGHTAFLGNDFHNLKKDMKPYYAEILIEKKRNNFFVLESLQKEVKKGMKYTGSVDYLRRTLSKTGTELFLIAELSDSIISKINLSFNNNEVSVDLFKSKLSDIEIDRWGNIYDVDTINNIPVVRTSTFDPSTSLKDHSWSYEKWKILKSFIEYGKELENKPVFIWNIMGNWGGDTQYPFGFIKNFNGLAEESAFYLTLHSPAVNQCYWPEKNMWIKGTSAYVKALNDDTYPTDSVTVERKRKRIEQIRIEKKYMPITPVKYWEIELPSAKKMGTYQGKAIILVNNVSGSASNNTVGASKSIPNSIVVGENTASSYTIGNMKHYQLKNSKIILWLPGCLFYHPDNKMEKGFFPDFWLNSDKPVEEIIEWLNNPDEYQFSLK